MALGVIGYLVLFKCEVDEEDNLLVLPSGSQLGILDLQS